VAVAATAATGAGEGEAVLPLIGLALIVTSVVVGGTWLARDVPGIIKELLRMVGDWAAVHEVTRRVDCKPWGLDKTFTILQDHATTTPAEDPLCSWAPVPGRRYEFGLSLWNGALALSRSLIERRASLSSGSFGKGRSVLELGCGQALVAMVVHELFPDLCRIVATDGSSDVLMAAEANVLANLGPETNKLELAVLSWSQAEDMERILSLNGGRPYDVILGADITYMEEHDELVRTIVAMSHDSTEVWITHEPRRRATEPLVERLRQEFRTVEETSQVLTRQETGRIDEVAVLTWYCTGKIAS